MNEENLHMISHTTNRKLLTIVSKQLAMPIWHYAVLFKNFEEDQLAPRRVSFSSFAQQQPVFNRFTLNMFVNRVLLHQACIIGDVDAVRWYINVGHKDVNQPDTNGCTALFYTIQKNHVVLVKDLVNAGVGGFRTCFHTLVIVIVTKRCCRISIKLFHIGENHLFAATTVYWMGFNFPKNVHGYFLRILDRRPSHSSLYFEK